MQLSNPKALIFFTAILPQFIDPRATVALQLAIFLALTYSGITVRARDWLATYVRRPSLISFALVEPVSDYARGSFVAGSRFAAARHSVEF